MTTVIKPIFETRVFIDGDGYVVIHQIGSGYDDEDGLVTDQLVRFHPMHLDSVIQVLRALK